MIQRDYVLRLIDRLAIVIRKLLGLRKAQQHQEAKLLIAQSLRELAGLDPALIDALASEDLIRLLATGGETDPGKCIATAALLEERSRVVEAEGDPEAAATGRLKALELYLYVTGLPGKESYLDQRERIKALVSDFSGRPLPAELQGKLNALLDSP